MAIENVQKIMTLDVYDHNTTPSLLKTIAFDNDSRYIAAEIRNEGVWLDVGMDSDVRLTVIRPDNVGVSISGQPYPFQYTHGDGIVDPDTGEEGTVSDTYYGVYAELTQAALVVPGIGYGQFKITNGSQILRTEIFQINNGRALDVEPDSWAGEYERHDVIATELLERMEAAETKANQAREVSSQLTTDLSAEVTRATAEEDRIESLVENKPLPVAENITPIYVGDYLSPFNYLPSCCVRVGDYIYAIDSLLRGEATSSGSNAGKIRKFDLVNNVEDKSWEKTADVGHANSIAYDTVNEKFYVVPIWVYSVGQETDASFLYVFDSDFNSEGTIQTPSVAGRVSYDSVKNKLYYCDFHYQVYEYDGADWNVVSVIDLTGISENTLLSRSYNQDFAVYDDQFYLSSPYGMIVRGKLMPGTSHVDMCCITDYEDSNRRFILGELEGMEFSQDGHLYAVEYVTLSADIRNAFIVELPTSIVAPPSSNIDGPIFTAYDSTLTLSEATQTKFYLRTDEVRSILQLACRKFLSQSSAIFVPSGNDVTEPYPIRINRNLELTLSGQYTVNKFNVLSGTLSISSDVAANRLTFLTNETPITLSRNGGLKFAGSQAINVKLDNLSSGNGFIRTGYSKCLINIRLAPVSLDNYSLRIGDNTELKYSNARYFGEDRLSENPASVALTYTSNNYVSQTAFNRLRLTQVSARLATLCINLVIDSGIIIPSSEVIIGSLNRVIDHEVLVVLAEQYGTGATITMTIKQNGDIVVASYSSVKTGGSLCIFRGEVPIILGSVYSN